MFPAQIPHEFCNSTVYHSIKMCTMLLFCSTTTESEGWHDGRDQHQTKEKATCIAPLITQTVAHYKNHTLHTKHKDHFPLALKRAKPKNSPNLLYLQKINYFRFHTVFNCLIRQRKSLPSLGTAAIYRTQNKVTPCACAPAHIFYSTVSVSVTKKIIKFAVPFYYIFLIYSIKQFISVPNKVHKYII